MGIDEFMIIEVIWITIGIVAFFYGFKAESNLFNNGVCLKCGKKLRYFDTDSHGGRGYTCDQCGYTTWVSYKRIDKNFKR